MHENKDHTDEMRENMAGGGFLSVGGDLRGNFPLRQQSKRKNICGKRKKRAVKFGKCKCVRRRRNQHE